MVSMSDVELGQLHRRVELWRWRFMIPGLALGILAILNGWGRTFGLLVLLPFLVAGLVCDLSLRPMRWVMDRRGIDWDHP